MSDTSKDDELIMHLYRNYSLSQGETNHLAHFIKQYGIQQRIDELDKLPRTGWISNGIRYDTILFTQIDNRKLELIELKDKQEDK